MVHTSDITFEKVQSRRTYESVVEQLEAMINRGDLLPGARLPSERDMAERLGVSRGVLSQAFRVLEERGIIEVRAGSGRSVRRLPMNGPETKRAVSELEKATMSDLLEVRRVLEATAVQLACERASEADIREIERLLEQSFVEPVELGLNERFHVHIAEATRNVVLANMLRLSIGLITKTFQQTAQSPGRVDAVHTEHRRIYEAIRNRDKEAAVQAVHDHIDNARSHLV